ncbi:hypothetical protein B0A48_16716 [Cryoendolithus antarcticus]|uniref:NAD-dependent epimerase/dehydratase domain-containing protein n=1 Tax=Cryoendolithus antarcticus TaxID=1507870 RepID=A0A1V8SEG6_9PEZI|nr:hypothetical protein B0A48_16716 [Cryoendolithus antarcticus]
MTDTSAGKIVLVTGGTGFIGSHCILQLLQAGYQAHTTIRKASRADEIKEAVRNGGVSEAQANGIKFFTADLMKDDGWEEACAGCTYVLHVASPFPAAPPKHEDELIMPAREGTLRVLLAAKKSGTVKRVVITSSYAAIGYGHADRTTPFTETDWTDLESGRPVPAYQKSKTIAERAAWDFVKSDGGALELAVVNPVGVFGPLLSSKGDSTSLEIIKRMLEGALPGLPQISFGAVDVRDVASLHLLAMTNPKAAGNRYLAVADGPFISFKDISATLKKGLPAQSKKVPTMQLPNFVLRLAALWDPAVRLITGELGKTNSASNAKAKTELGHVFKTSEESVISAAESLIKLGVVKV